MRRGSSEGSTGSGPTADPSATITTPHPPPSNLPPHQQQNTADSESITLSDDSLNELDEYQSPYILQTTANRLHLAMPENEDEMVDSLQPPGRQQRAPLYPDSLNHPNGLFDSMEEEEAEARPVRRLIQPYLDNSLSTGSYTSEQEEEEEELETVNRVQQQLQLHNNINMKVFINIILHIFLLLFVLKALFRIRRISIFLLFAGSVCFLAIASKSVNFCTDPDPLFLHTDTRNQNKIPYKIFAIRNTD
jgi:hypothetical protein